MMRPKIKISQLREVWPVLASTMFCCHCGTFRVDLQVEGEIVPGIPTVVGMS